MITVFDVLEANHSIMTPPERLYYSGSWRRQRQLKSEERNPQYHSGTNVDSTSKTFIHFFPFLGSCAKPATMSASLAEVLMIRNRSGPSRIPPYHLVTTNMTFQTSMSCIK